MKGSIIGKSKVPRNSFVIVGLFGNEWAMERAIEKLAAEPRLTYEVTDRRTLTVMGSRKDVHLRTKARDIISESKGHIEMEE